MSKTVPVSPGTTKIEIILKEGKQGRSGSKKKSSPQKKKEVNIFDLFKIVRKKRSTATRPPTSVKPLNKFESYLVRILLLILVSVIVYGYLTK